MKKLFYLLTIVLFFTLSSCVDQDTPETTFTLFNDSTQNVLIKPYARNRTDGVISGGSVAANFININSNLKKTFLREHRDDRTFYSIKYVDSVRVIFGNSKLLVFVCDDWPSMANCNTIFLGDTNYEYHITEEDYNSAIDCNGDCE